MKNNFLKILLLNLICFNSINSYGQKIIDYSLWTSSTGCNIFSIPSNASTEIDVPAKINAVDGTVAHLTTVGQPQYDATNKTVNLDSKFVNGSQFQGTEYRMTVNFKKGYTYKITVTAARIISSPSGGNVLLRLDLNNGGNGTNNQCNGTGIIDPN
jgi:hypothetical protein